MGICLECDVMLHGRRIPFVLCSYFVSFLGCLMSMSIRRHGTTSKEVVGLEKVDWRFISQYPMLYSILINSL